MKQSGRIRKTLQTAAAQLSIVLLCEVLMVQAGLAQQPAQTFGLKVRTDAVNAASTTVKSASTEPPVVQVMDANDRPIQGALVIFTTPDNGSSGVFEDGTRTQTVATDREGRAVAVGYRANATAGSYPILVHVEFLNEIADASVVHTNIAAAKSSKKMLTILAVAGGGAAGLLLAAKGGGGTTGGTGTTGTTIPTISFGDSVVGGPGQ